MTNSSDIQTKINAINAKIDAIDPRYMELSAKWDDSELTDAEGIELTTLHNQAIIYRAQRDVLADELGKALRNETGFLGTEE